MWDFDHIARWINKIAIQEGLSEEYCSSLRLLSRRLYDLVVDKEIKNLREPQVDYDPEGGMDLVWANKRLERTLLITIDPEAPEGQEAEALIVEGRNGHSVEAMDDKMIEKVLRWYIGDEPWGG